MHTVNSDSGMCCSINNVGRGGRQSSR